MLALLKNPDVGTRAGAALFLAAGPESAAHIPALLDCLRDPVVNNYCGNTLVKVAGPGSAGRVPLLRKSLQDPDKTVRLYAAAALGQIGPKAGGAVAGLAPLL